MQAVSPQAWGLRRVAHTCCPSIVVPRRRSSLLPRLQQKHRTHPGHGSVPCGHQGSTTWLACSRIDAGDATDYPFHPEAPGRSSAWLPDLKAAGGGAFLLGLALLSWGRPANARYVGESAQPWRVCPCDQSSVPTNCFQVLGMYSCKYA